MSWTPPDSDSTSSTSWQPPETDMLHDTTLAGRDARVGAINNFIGDVGKQALQAAMPSPEAFKPLTPTSPNPILGGAQAALQTLRDPTRISPTVSQPGQVAGEAVKKATGSGVAGFVTSVLADPQTYLGMGKGQIPEGMQKQLSKLGEVLTGVDKRSFQTLANQPEEVLKAAPSSVTGKIFGDMKAQAGVTPVEERALATDIDVSRKSYNKIMENVDKGQTPSVADLLRVKIAGNKIVQSDPSASGQVARDIGNKVNPLLEQIAPDVYNAQQANHMSQVKESFMNIFPQGKNMMNYFRTISMLAGSAIHGIGALESPVVAGAATLAGSQAIKYGATAGGINTALKGFNLSQISPTSYNDLVNFKGQLANGQ